jgi:hypothetical protein
VPQADQRRTRDAEAANLRKTFELVIRIFSFAY